MHDVASFAFVWDSDQLACNVYNCIIHISPIIMYCQQKGTKHTIIPTTTQISILPQISSVQALCTQKGQFGGNVPNDDPLRTTGWLLYGFRFSNLMESFRAWKYGS